MDPDLIVIFGFILAITAMAFGIGFQIMKREHAHKERKLEQIGRASCRER